MPFFAFPSAIRKMIYTTNAVESLNRSLRIRHAGLRWKPSIAWSEAKQQFMILFADRITGSAG
jgi:transposase-like protein